MSDSSQAKEVVLEVGEELSSQEYSIQVENGTVTKTVFDACENNCTNDVLNANNNLTGNWNGWHRMTCSSIRQIGEAPSVWSGPGQPPPQMTNFGQLDLIFDGVFTGGFGESNLIVFDLQTSLGGNPLFNGVTWSQQQSNISAVNNLRTDGRADTEQGRLLYLVPNSGAPSNYSTNISFEILEGRGSELLVRGAGGKNIGQFLHENGYDFVDIEDINDDDTFWSHFEFYISPYIHSSKWQYDFFGNVDYDSERKSIHASYVQTPSGGILSNCISNSEDVYFGIRSSDSLFYSATNPLCIDNPTHGFQLQVNVEVLENAIVEVLTWATPGQTAGLDFALEYAGVNQAYSWNWVWEKIETVGLKSVCVPWYYNVANLQEGGGGILVRVDGLMVLQLESKYKLVVEEFHQVNLLIKLIILHSINFLE